MKKAVRAKSALKLVELIFQHASSRLTAIDVERYTGLKISRTTFQRWKDALVRIGLLKPIPGISYAKPFRERFEIDFSCLLALKPSIVASRKGVQISDADLDPYVFIGLDSIPPEDADQARMAMLRSGELNVEKHDSLEFSQTERIAIDVMYKMEELCKTRLWSSGKSDFNYFTFARNGADPRSSRYFSNFLKVGKFGINEKDFDAERYIKAQFLKMPMSFCVGTTWGRPYPAPHWICTEKAIQRYRDVGKEYPKTSDIPVKTTFEYAHVASKNFTLQLCSLCTAHMHNGIATVVDGDMIQKLFLRSQGRNRGYMYPAVLAPQIRDLFNRIPDRYKPTKWRRWKQEFDSNPGAQMHITNAIKDGVKCGIEDYFSKSGSERIPLDKHELLKEDLYNWLTGTPTQNYVHEYYPDPTKPKNPRKVIPNTPKDPSLGISSEDIDAAFIDRMFGETA